MAKVTTVSEVAGMDEDDIIKVLKGRVKQVYKPRTGETNGKEWKFQDVILEDDEGEVKVTLANREDDFDKDLVGEIVYFTSSQTKHGWQGVKVKRDKFTTKHGEKVNRLVCHVTKTAEITPGADWQGEPKKEDDDDQELADKGLAPQTKRPEPTKSKPATNGEPEKAWARARKTVAQASNAYLLCLKAARHTEEQAVKQLGLKMTEDHFQAMTASLFIHLDRSGILIQLPSGQMSVEAAQQSESSAPPPEKKKPAPNPEPEPAEPVEEDVPF